MQCPKCHQDNRPESHRCAHCGGSLSIAMLEVARGDVAEKIHFLQPRSYSLGRARHNDLAMNEPSISKVHARILYEEGRFFIEDQGSLHGVYLNAAKVERAELAPGAELQLGNVTLKFSLLGNEGSTGQISEYPWVEQQQLLLSLVQTLNSTLVLSQVLEQVLDAVMRITRAERGFLLLAEDAAVTDKYDSVAGLRLRLGRRRGDPAPLSELQGISTSVIRRAMETGEIVATGDAAADPELNTSRSVVAMELRTIVCIPLGSPRAQAGAKSRSPALGALYVDNSESSAAFGPDSLRAVEALARHAALAIENAQLFEREQRTIEELREAQKRLLQSEKLAAIGQMAAGIAHELNTPLTYIMGNLELLEAQSLTPAQREMIASMVRGADRIKRLAQGLLAFSRPAQEELTPLSANEVIERGLELCHYQIVKSGVRLAKRLDATNPRVRGVANQLEMALINLTVNAIQAMAGTGGGLLTVTTARQGEEVEISVSDTGPGVPEAIRNSLFEPFVTSKAEGRGTGLGLSTVLMVVERHQGHIDYTSSGSGTTFRIRLPVA